MHMHHGPPTTALRGTGDVDRSNNRGCSQPSPRRIVASTRRVATQSRRGRPLAEDLMAPRCAIRALVSRWNFGPRMSHADVPGLCSR
jgi:hypothetical protein